MRVLASSVDDISHTKATLNRLNRFFFFLRRNGPPKRQILDTILKEALRVDFIAIPRD